MDCSMPGSLSFTISQNFFKFMYTESVMLSNHFILCCPFPLSPSISPSIKVFSNESVLCIRLPKYWSFSFSISSSNECSGLISFRIDWFDILAVHRTLKRLQYPSWKASILQLSGFFMIQLSHCLKLMSDAKPQIQETHIQPIKINEKKKKNYT